ncbi:6-phosphogluconate dehydrogenase (decarboxylating) [Roseiarcus fermentans]|uniref:6-phosphogluconate dehydrogenase, decarboxylating n=1 Tax=Roseiarcus fermentans TaxID=1473586 RepID=A0A366FRX1_9HYPH|nr:NADP-dependent phosphogluconate dehydrogenase [Roseiarcus fermentans]RBP16479.1 6-phosphogluconate dehydrogenase (decarboxylating) [Roseiarcus fermentans]
MPELADIGVLGLAVMGANLARNAARKGFGVALYNRHPERTDELVREHGGEGRFLPSKTLEDFVASLARPRAILVMVQAGKAVDDVIAELSPLLEADDIVIDGGNSLFTDTARRCKACADKGIRFLGMGVSGGEVGALEGPSMMPGGDRSAYDRLAPILDRMAASVDGTPCCVYVGPGGAGHYVKMVHNGIEYADMQLIAEAYDLMKSLYGLDAPALAGIFSEWKQGDLDSYLIEITATVLRKTDAGGQPLVDVILDEAEQKGTGRWTAQSALDLGVPLTAITEAVYARALSAQRARRAEVERKIGRSPPPARKAGAAAIAAVRDALYASKVVAYAQGFEQMAAASAEFGWDLKLADMATIWRGGCIIRARLLDRIRAAYDRDPKLGTLLLDDDFLSAVTMASDAWRAVVGLAVANGVPAPAFSSALAYFDGLGRARGPANLLQGLRDYFGAHTYRRLDKPGRFHTLWSEGGAEVQVDR